MERDPYARISRRELYRNRWLAVEAHEIVHPNGAPGEHLLVVTPPACAILVEDGGELVFAKQPRFAARRWVLEAVKGGAEPGESLAESAARELREELGARAAAWSSLGRLYELPSIVAPAVAVYLARDVRFGDPQPEDVESVTAVRVEIGAAIDAALSGRIDDAVTVAAIVRYAVAEGRLVRAATATDSTRTRASRRRR